MPARPTPLLLQVHVALAAIVLSVPSVQGGALGTPEPAATKPEAAHDANGPLHFVVPEADSAQPPYIHDQAELEILLRGEPAIDLSNGSLHLRDGRPMPLRNLDEMGGLLEEPRVGPSALDGTQVGVSYVDLIVN